MITKPDILAMVRHVMRRGRGLPDRRLMHPYREWFAILITSLGAVIAAAAYSAYLFDYYATIETRVDAAPDAPVEYQAKTIDRALEYIDARQEAFDAARGTAIPTDPAPPPTEDAAPVPAGTPSLR